VLTPSHHHASGFSCFLVSAVGLPVIKLDREVGAR
jgi:hypothetical protein